MARHTSRVHGERTQLLLEWQPSWPSPRAREGKDPVAWILLPIILGAAAANHNEIDIDLTRSKRDPSADWYRTDSFRVELIDDDPVLHARLAWRGEKVPVFVCTAHESGGRSVSAYLSLFGLEVRVRRLSESQ